MLGSDLVGCWVGEGKRAKVKSLVYASDFMRIMVSLDAISEGTDTYSCIVGFREGVTTMKLAEGISSQEVPILILGITVIIEKDDESYHAYCPAFSGLHIDGSTENEALSNTKEALHLYISSLVSHGDPIPVGATLHDRKH